MEVLDSQAVGGMLPEKMGIPVPDPIVSLIQDAIVSSPIPHTSLLDIPDVLMKLDGIRYGLDVPHHTDRIADLCHAIQSHSSLSIQRANELMATFFPSTTVRLSVAASPKTTQSSRDLRRSPRTPQSQTESSSILSQVMAYIMRWFGGR